MCVKYAYMSTVMYAYTLRDIGMTHRSKLNFSNGGREHPQRESLAVGESGVWALICFCHIFAVLVGFRFGV